MMRVAPAVLSLTVAATMWAAPARAAQQPTQPDYLFSINTSGGTIKGVGKDTGKERLKLTLRGVNDHATQFADRPFNDAYVLSTTDLVARWPRWFRDAAPNAVLTFNKRRDRMPHSIVVKLRKPRYNEAKRTLVFTARHLHRSPDMSPDALERISVPARRPPARFMRGSLFIDAASDAPVVDGCTFQVRTVCETKDFSGKDLAGVTMWLGSFGGSSFVDANLSGVQAGYALFIGADLSRAGVPGAYFSFAVFSGATLNGVIGDARTSFEFARMNEVVMNDAILAGSDFFEASVTRSQMRNADLRGAMLMGANFSGTDLTGVMTDPQTTCPDGSPGPCVTDSQWRPEAPLR